MMERLLPAKADETSQEPSWSFESNTSTTELLEPAYWTWERWQTSNQMISFQIQEIPYQWTESAAYTLDE